MKGRSVRENTVLSFQKAATNMVDFIEFDVHVTADGEVVCFHDFEVKLGIGSEVVRLGIPALSYSQLKRCRLLFSCHTCLNPTLVLQSNSTIVKT